MAETDAKVRVQSRESEFVLRVLSNDVHEQSLREYISGDVTEFQLGIEKMGETSERAQS